jgi:mRNA interferase MazF
MPPQRGEVYFVDLNPVIGREQRGRRPVVVVSNDRINGLPLVVSVVPGTKGINVRADYPHSVRVPAGEGNLPEETVFMTIQMRALDHSRFQEAPRGILSPSYMAQLEQALAWTLALQTGAGQTP